MSSKIFDNLKKDLFKVAQEMTGEKRDTRFQDWAKIVTAVDPSGKTGYAFEGDFINDGTVELDLNKPVLTLVMFRHGSRNYNYAEYAVVKVNIDGSLEATHIMTSDTDGRGWALRIRDDLADMLAEIDKDAAMEPRELTDREHSIMMLGYNQAMLDYAQFPITGAGDPLERASVEKIVADLKEKLGL